jgi:hypothetical protein
MAHTCLHSIAHRVLFVNKKTRPLNYQTELLWSRVQACMGKWTRRRLKLLAFRLLQGCLLWEGHCMPCSLASLFSLMQLSATGQGAAGPLSLSACRKGAFLVFSDDRHHTTTGIGGSVYKSPHPATPSFSTSPQQHTPHLHPVPFLSCASARRLKKVECETDRRKGLEKNKKKQEKKN